MRRSAAAEIVLRLGRVACKAAPVTRTIGVCGHAVCVRPADGYGVMSTLKVDVK